MWEKDVQYGQNIKNCGRDLIQLETVEVFQDRLNVGLYEFNSLKNLLKHGVNVPAKEREKKELNLFSVPAKFGFVSF